MCTPTGTFRLRGSSRPSLPPSLPPSPLPPTHACVGRMMRHPATGFSTHALPRVPSRPATYVCSVYSDKCVPSVCLEFCRANGKLLMASGLRYNLLLHLLNLWDNALVDTETICACMAVVDAP
jgi:hypothetical protein